ncbi:cupin domain-containing protein [Patescibacteria group bacterium]
MQSKVLKPTSNPDTVNDERGGIFTWVPDESIEEFNLVYINKGFTRGHHYHPEFTEYFLVVKGEGVMYVQDKTTKTEDQHFMSVGSCMVHPKGVAHTFYAHTDVLAIAMITKPWTKCSKPIKRKVFKTIK